MNLLAIGRMFPAKGGKDYTKLTKMNRVQRTQAGGWVTH